MLTNEEKLNVAYFAYEDPYEQTVLVYPGDDDYDDSLPIVPNDNDENNA